MSENATILQNLKKSVETWDFDLMQKSVEDALSAGISPDVIVSQGLGKGMETISDQFNEGLIYLPQVLMASKTMEGALELLRPRMEANDHVYRGTVVMGTVQGDIHEIGKNVCCAMLRGAGYRVIDLGPDVSPDIFVEAAKKYEASIVGGSALMTTTLVRQEEMVKTTREDGCPVFLIFGGAPCTPEWVEKIGGDGYSASGAQIVRLVKSLMEVGPARTTSLREPVHSTGGDS